MGERAQDLQSKTEGFLRLRKKKNPLNYLNIFLHDERNIIISSHLMILCGKQENMYILQENKRFLREGKKNPLCQNFAHKGGKCIKYSK